MEKYNLYKWIKKKDKDKIKTRIKAEAEDPVSFPTSGQTNPATVAVPET